MRVYWEHDWDDGGTTHWSDSANARIKNRQRFLNVTEAVQAFVADGGSAGLRYRLVREDGTPLFIVDGGDIYRADAF